MRDVVFLTCTRCSVLAGFVQETSIPVCADCRCHDCQIVMGIQCERCKQVHGIRSTEIPEICTDCYAIRVRVTNMAPEFLVIRNMDMRKEDPFYE